MTKGLCMKCKKLVEITKGIEIKTPNGEYILSGECPIDNHKVVAYIGRSSNNISSSNTNVSISSSNTNINISSSNTNVSISSSNTNVRSISSSNTNVSSITH
jgi:hypothetical protein